MIIQEYSNVQQLASYLVVTQILKFTIHLSPKSFCIFLQVAVQLHLQFLTCIATCCHIILVASQLYISIVQVQLAILVAMQFVHTVHVQHYMQGRSKGMIHHCLAIVYAPAYTLAIQLQLLLFCVVIIATRCKRNTLKVSLHCVVVQLELPFHVIMNSKRTSLISI